MKKFRQWKVRKGGGGKLAPLHDFASMTANYFEMQYLAEKKAAYRQVPVPGGQVLDLETQTTISVTRQDVREEAQPAGSAA